MRRITYLITCLIPTGCAGTLGVTSQGVTYTPPPADSSCEENCGINCFGGEPVSAEASASVPGAGPALRRRWATSAKSWPAVLFRSTR